MTRNPDKPWRFMPWMTTRICRLRWHWLMHLDHYQDGDALHATKCACGYQP